MTYILHTEAELQAYPNVDFVDFYEQQVIRGHWQLSPSISLHYCYAKHENAKACIVVFPGRAEAIVKYAELIHDLYNNGYSVFAIDHRGQGASSRMLNNRHMGYVEHFGDYVEDAKVCIDKVLFPLLQQDDKAVSMPLHLLCHSMGGAIGALFIAAYPNMFKKVVYSAPMWGIHAPVPEFVVNGIVKTVSAWRRLMGYSIHYFWGQIDYQAFPFSTNRLTNSEARYDVFRQVMAKYPENQLGGISFEWLKQAIQGMQEVRRLAPTHTLSSLILQAEQEQIISNKRLQATAALMPNAQTVLIEKAQHEILFEQDAARERAMHKILDFYNSP